MGSGTLGIRLPTRRIACVSALLALAALLLVAAPAGAAAPKLFTSFPEGAGGSGADQLDDPRAIATDPGNGHVYVAEVWNSRISEFTAWGEFVKAWGWGVVASGPGNKPQNEIQEVALEPGVTSGTFKLVYRNPVGAPPEQATVAIAYDASAATVREALEGVPSLAPGDVAVTGPDGGPWAVEFVGSSADMDIAPLEITGSTLVGGQAVVNLVQGGANFEVCEPSEGDVCRAGQRAGASPGQIVWPKGLTVDPSTGDLYVYEGEIDFLKSLRVQKFSPATGDFLTMFGGEVNKTSGANVCSQVDLEGGDVCGTGVPGAANGYFLNTIFGASGGNIAVDDVGTVYVGDEERIQKFDSGGIYQGSLPLPASGTTKALTFDSASGDLYFAFAQTTTSVEPEQPDVYKLDPVTGAVDDKVEVDFPMALSTDSLGNLYVVVSYRGMFLSREEVISFDASGEPVIALGEGFDVVEAATSPHGGRRPGLAVNSACGTTGIYVANPLDDTIDAYGPTPNPSLCPPPLVPPTITDQYAVSVGSDHAVVRGAINPRFWEDTRYYVQYGTADCSLGGCLQQPLGEGVLLPDAGVSQPLTTAGLTLSGLQPSTTYHYRFVAKSSGGGPVFGIGEDELGATFTTRPLPGGPNVDCPNQVFRKGAGAALPDCRAYEMVSPVDKGGGNAIARPSGAGPTSLNQSAEGGDRFSFSSYRAFGEDAEASTFSTQYIVNREAAGWATKSITPPNGVSFVNIGNTVGNEFQAFAADLCDSWFVRNTDPPLSASAPQSYANIYSRQNCSEAGPGYTAMINVPVLGSATIDFWPELQGLSADGGTAVFRANGRLTENASNSPGIAQVYAETGGSLRLVSVLPNGIASSIKSTVGSRYGLGKNRTDSVDRAVSDDGSLIYWTQETAGNGSGKLYVRVGDTETREVSELISGEAARFVTASEDGSVAFFAIGESLYEYDFAADSSTLVAGKTPGVIGASADASQLYLVSREALAAGATAEAPNLYLYEGGGLSFVALLSSRDASVETRSAINREPNEHVSRVSGDGLHLAFTSTSKALSLSTAGYDNTDANSGEPDAQVYVYDATSEQLNCVSCDPTGVRPSGRKVADGFNEEPDFWAAAEIPGWPSQLYSARAFAEDGRRLFFNAYTSLTAADINGATDVYQWELPGTGDCTETSPSYVGTAGGCVSLISSGTSPQDSEFVDASEGGDDVFFTTEASLVKKDPAQIDIYDARVGGGFVEPAGPSDCVGEGCQPLPPAPVDPAPTTSKNQGPGNVKEGSSPKKCPKGKHKVKKKGKVRCVKNKKKKSGKGTKATRAISVQGRAGA